MKENRKRVLSLLLVLVMLAGMFPSSAFADGEVKLRIDCNAPGAAVTVYEKNVNGEAYVVQCSGDGYYHILPGTYYYAAEADGYLDLEMTPFEVTAEAEQAVAVTMTPEGQPAADDRQESVTNVETQGNPAGNSAGDSAQGDVKSENTVQGTNTEPKWKDTVTVALDQDEDENDRLQVVVTGGKYPDTDPVAYKLLEQDVELKEQYVAKLAEQLDKEESVTVQEIVNCLSLVVVENNEDVKPVTLRQPDPKNKEEERPKVKLAVSGPWMDRYESPLFAAWSNDQFDLITAEKDEEGVWRFEAAELSLLMIVELGDPQPRTAAVLHDGVSVEVAGVLKGAELTAAAVADETLNAALAPLFPTEENADPDEPTFRTLWAAELGAAGLPEGTVTVTVSGAALRGVSEDAVLYKVVNGAAEKVDVVWNTALGSLTFDTAELGTYVLAEANRPVPRDVNVTVNYVDKAGEELLPSAVVVLPGAEEERTELLPAPEIAGYAVLEESREITIPGWQTEPMEAALVYVPATTLTIYYVDALDQALAETEVRPLPILDEEQTIIFTAPEVEGYVADEETLTLTVPANLAEPVLHRVLYKLAPEERTLTAVMGEQTVTVHGVLPADAELLVVAVPLETAAAIYENQTGIKTKTKEILFAYDVCVVSEGEKYDLEAFGESVTVSVTNTKAEQKTVDVLHVKTDVTDGNGGLDEEKLLSLMSEKAEKENLTAKTESGEVVFDLTGFSLTIAREAKSTVTEVIENGVQKSHSGTGVTDNGLRYDWSISWTNAADGNNVEYWKEGERLLLHPTDWVYVDAGIVMSIVVNKASEETQDDAVIPAGAVTLTIPGSIFSGWSGGAVDIIETQIKETAVSGSYFIRSTDENGNIVLTNILPFNGGRGFEAKLYYRVDPTNINGGHPVSNDVDATRTASKWWLANGTGDYCYTDYYTNDFPFTFVLDEDMDGTPNVRATGKLGVDAMTRSVGYLYASAMPTAAGVQYNHVQNGQVMSSTSQGVYLAWQSQWGTKPDNADNYFYIVWNLNYARGQRSRLWDATQPWTTTLSYDPARTKNHVVIKGIDCGPGEVVGTLKSNDVTAGACYYADGTYTYIDAPNVGNSSLNGLGNGVLTRNTRNVYQDGYLGQQNRHEDPSARSLGTISSYSGGTQAAFLVRYPWSLFERAQELGLDFTREAIEIYAEFTAKEHWDSNYDNYLYKSAGPVRVSMEPRGPGGTFSKTRIPTYPEINGAQTFLMGGNSVDLKSSTMSWKMSFSGYSSQSAGKPLGQQITITEPRNGVLQFSGSGARNYNGWNPSDQVNVNEDNFELTRFYLTALEEYGGQYVNNIWTTDSAPDTHYSDWKDVVIQTRARGSSEWVDYVTVRRRGTNSSGKPTWTIKKVEDGNAPGGNTTAGYLLPANTVQIRLKHDSEYSRTTFTLWITARILPTETVQSIIDTHMGKKWTTYVKNAAFYESEPLKDPPSTEPDNFGRFSGTNFGDSQANYNYLELSKLSPELSLSKSSYWPDPEADQAQKEANERGGQINYVRLCATSYADMLSDFGNANDNLVTPYKLLKGTFYELLPPGTTFDPDSIIGFYDLYHQNNSNGQIISAARYREYVNSNVNTVNRLRMNSSEWSYETYTDAATGQTMLVIHYDVTDRGFAKKCVTERWYSRAVFLFIMRNSYDNVAAHGTTTLNALGFVNEYENAYTPVTSTLENAALGALEGAFTGINANNEYAAFTKANIKWKDPEVIEFGIDKTVSVPETLNGVPVMSSYLPSGVATVGSPYIYRIHYATASDTKADHLVLYDILETGTSNKQSAWRGSFISVDLSALQQKSNDNDASAFCNPVLYYSTTLSSAVSTEGDYFDLTDTGNWIPWNTSPPSDPSVVTAIAIDCSTDTKGNPFVLGEEQSASALITVNAPPEMKTGDAVNGVVVGCAPFPSTMSHSEGNIRRLSADASVSLRDVNVSLVKASDPKTGTPTARTIVDSNGDGTIVYRLTVRSAMPYDINNVVVSDPIPEGLSLDKVTVKLNGATSETAGDSTLGFSYELAADGRSFTFRIGKQYPTVIETDTEGNETVVTNKDTEIYIYTKVDELKDAEGKQVLLRDYDNTATLVSANGKNIGEDTDTMYHRAETTTLDVEKLWDDANDRYRKRPSSIVLELTGTVVTGKDETTGEDIVETVDLNGSGEGNTIRAEVQAGTDGNWKYTFENLRKYWVVTDSADYETPNTWYEVKYTVTEQPITDKNADGSDVLDENGIPVVLYTPVYKVDENTGKVTVTNRYGLAYGSLIIVKNLPVYERSEPASFAFSVVGTLGEGENERVVYSNVAMITLSSHGSKSTVLHNIPAGAQITVTELGGGSSHYTTQATTATATIVADDTVSVNFTNTYTPNDTGGHGVINMFSYDGSNGWKWSKGSGSPEPATTEGTAP